MSENNSSQEMNKYLFVNLVTMLGISAMQQLGKIINPATGKAELNLEAAQATIDTLDMLSTKTRGNLDADEERLMKDTLSSLKMNFVETTSEMKNVEGRMQNEKSQDKMPPEEPKDRAPKSESPAQEKSEAKPEAEPPKFHKSYS